MIGCLHGAHPGAGTTTLAVAAAQAMARSGARTLLIDANAASGGDVAALLQALQIRTVADLTPHWPRLHGAALTGFLQVPHTGVGALAWPVIGSGDAAAIAHATELLARLQSAFDHILIDAGTVPSWPVGALWRATTDWFIVSTPTIAGVRALQRVRDWCAQALVPTTQITVLCNRWGDDGELSQQSVQEQLRGEALRFVPRLSDPLSGGHRFWTDAVATSPTHGTAAVCPERVWNCLSDVESLTSVLLPETASVSTECLAQIHAAIAWESLPSGDAARDGWLDTQLAQLLSQHPDWRPAHLPPPQFLTMLRHELLGLGPLEPLLHDPAVTEIMVNGPDAVWLERHGLLEATAIRFHSAAHLRHIVDRMVLPTGRRVDESTPIVDTRLPDGSRVSVVLPPIALQGPTITIRRFRRHGWSLAELVAAGALPDALAGWLRGLVATRKNLLVIGGTGSGKTTLLNALSGAITAAERIVTIEDAAELQLPQPHVVRLEARPANIEGEGQITIRDLVRTALRMRPDRIIVGECRGAEALDMLQAMNTGHDGSMTTVHANSPQDALHRLATLVCFAGLELPLHAIHQQISGAIDYVVEVARRPDGSRGVRAVAQVTGMIGDAIQLEECYRAPDLDGGGADAATR